MIEKGSSNILRTGIDLVEVSRLMELKVGIKQRFLQRVFTERELHEAEESAQYLAGRFAAKEAVAKALGSGIGLVAWKEIEILRGLNGEPLLVLGEKAQELSEEAGIISWSLSISHTSKYALALTVATGKDSFDNEKGKESSEDISNEDSGSQ